MIVTTLCDDIVIAGLGRPAHPLWWKYKYDLGSALAWTFWQIPFKSQDSPYEYRLDSFYTIINTLHDTFIITDSILVVGGLDGDAYKDTVELFGLTSGTRPRRLRKFPKKISSAVGATLGELGIHSN